MPDEFSSERGATVAESSGTPQGGDVVDESTRQKLDAQRVEFGNTVKNYFPVLFILTVIIAASLILLIALGFSFNRTMDATVLAASVQVAFGMVLGFVCVYIGLMMTWLGIDAAYSVKGNVGAGAFVLKSASPGLLFALGGMVLVSVSLHKQIVYEENSKNLVGTKAIDPNASRSEVNPESPKQFHVMPPGASPSPQPQPSVSQPSHAATFPGHVPLSASKPSATNSTDNPRQPEDSP